MEKIFNRYIKQVTNYADIQFKIYLLPWLIKYHLEMQSGNGETFIYYSDNTPEWFIKKYRLYNFPGCWKSLDTTKIPIRLQKVLGSIVPGVNGSLGEFMPDLEIKNGHRLTGKENRRRTPSS